MEYFHIKEFLFCYIRQRGFFTQSFCFYIMSLMVNLFGFLFPYFSIASLLWTVCPYSDKITASEFKCNEYLRVVADLVCLRTWLSSCQLLSSYGHFFLVQIKIQHLSSSKMNIYPWDPSGQ